jgi:hypothetical protein
MKTSLQQRKDKTPKKIDRRRNKSVTELRLRYKFWILIGVLALAGISIILRIETPVVWTFLYGIGGWAALTTNPGNNLR